MTQQIHCQFFFHASCFRRFPTGRHSWWHCSVGHTLPSPSSHTSCEHQQSHPRAFVVSTPTVLPAPALVWTPNELMNGPSPAPPPDNRKRLRTFFVRVTARIWSKAEAYCDANVEHIYTVVLGHFYTAAFSVALAAEVYFPNVNFSRNAPKKNWASVSYRWVVCLLSGPYVHCMCMY